MTFFMKLRLDLSLFMIFFTEWVVFILLSREGINILIMGFSMQEVCHSWTGTVFKPPPPFSLIQIIILYSVNLWPIDWARPCPAWQVVKTPVQVAKHKLRSFYWRLVEVGVYVDDWQQLLACSPSHTPSHSSPDSTSPHWLVLVCSSHLIRFITICHFTGFLSLNNIEILIPVFNPRT